MQFVNNTRRVAPFVHAVTARLQASHHFGNCHFGSSHRQHTFGSQFVHSRSPRAITAHSSAFGACGSPDYDACIVESGKNEYLHSCIVEHRYTTYTFTDQDHVLQLRTRKV